MSCQNEKSQIQNRAAAMRVLQARLLLRREQEQRAAMNALRDEGNSWGNQMRSYVLHPYQMVKDLRTEVETGNPAAVLDGDLDPFIEAGIRWRRQSEPAAQLTIARGRRLTCPDRCAWWLDGADRTDEVEPEPGGRRSTCSRAQLPRRLRRLNSNDRRLPAVGREVRST